jgi:hypothetical protein
MRTDGIVGLALLGVVLGCGLIVAIGFLLGLGLGLGVLLSRMGG